MMIDRRAFLQAAGLLPLAACSPAAPATSSLGGVLALDWALAETMVAIGQRPAGVVAVADYARFVIEPPLPPGTADLGLQQELNFELIAALRPRLILISPFLQRLKPTLDRIAPSLNLSVYEVPETPLANRIAITRELARQVDATARGETYIGSLEAVRADAMQRLSRLNRRPVLPVSFIDNRHARVYGGSSLYTDTLAWLGLDSAWSKPVPPDISHALSSSPLWNELPFVKASHEGRIPPVFMFGGLPSAERFAKLIVDHLETRWSRA